RKTVIADNVEIGPFTIIEAGAVLGAGTVVPAHKPMHARKATRVETPATALLNVADYEAAAMAKLPKPVFDYFAGGAEDERALARNRKAFGEVLILPRVLVDVSAVSTRYHLLQHELASPILAAPVAMQTLLHPEGELGLARAVRRLRMSMCLSTLSTT